MLRADLVRGKGFEIGARLHGGAVFAADGLEVQVLIVCRIRTRRIWRRATGSKNLWPRIYISVG